MDKKTARLRRARRTRIKMKEQDKVRLSVFRTPQHIYAQVFSGDGARVLACASTVEKTIKAECGHTGNVEASRTVGRVIAERARNNGVNEVAFDRSGYKYHGRVKALAEAARENGLKF